MESSCFIGYSAKCRLLMNSGQFQSIEAATHRLTVKLPKAPSKEQNYPDFTTTGHPSSQHYPDWKLQR